jgi:signal transduction histidine kinase/CheY-like chemotaxis protein/HPt (histidine-containing phosphotransfer) domain-containing protein/streptogramin lyase
MSVRLVDDKRINNERILRLVSDSEGNVFGQTKNGAVFALENGAVTEYYDSSELGTATITTILADPFKPRTLYFGSNANCLYYGTFGQKVDELKKIDTGDAESIHWMSYDCGVVWVTSDSVIGYLDDNSFFVQLDGLPMNDAIEMVTSDYQGNMWFASSRQGVMKIVANNFLDYTRSVGIEDLVVNTTCKYKDVMYIGTDSGLTAVDSRGLETENALTGLTDGARIRCLMADSAGYLWVSTFTNGLGLLRYDGGENVTEFNIAGGMPSNEIRCTFEAPDGRIFAGTNNGIVIIKDGRIEKTYGSSEGFKNPVILTVCEGLDGKIYAGSDGGGLYIVDGSSVKNLTTDNSTLTSDVIMRFKPDSERNVLWMITSNSIQYIKDGEIKEVSTFPYNNNFDMINGSGSDIWILCSQGLYVTDAESMIADNITKYKTYTLTDGLTSLPVAHCYSYLDESGDLYIAGQSGVSKVNIKDYTNVRAHIITNVGAVYIDDEFIYPDERGNYVIPAQTKRITIEPSVLDFTLSNPLVRVFLEGAKDSGITSDLNGLSSLEFTGLGYGNYTLHIQILTQGANEVLSDTRVNIRKEPQLLELLSVRVLLALLVVAVAGFAVWRVMNGTVIRRQYAQIQEAKEEAERANSAKSQFLANMSHEIRTPINTIIGMDEMILREDAAGVPKNYSLAVKNNAVDIKSAAETLLSLINDLLDISKIESGKMHLVEEEYDIADMLRSIVTMIRVRADAKKLYFDVDVDETLPGKLYGDDGKIKQIVLNLLTNAVKYTDEGGFTLKVSVTSKNDLSCSLRISVKDTGIGVKSEDLKRLFNAYERLDEEKNSGIQGTGLGLDISRQFAELMNGRLWCESVYGQGSEFILTVTQKIADPKELGVFREEENSRGSGKYIPKFVAPDADILVVDDNPMNLNVIKGLLKPTKVFVTTAESGKECLDKLKMDTFNVVFLDHMMPGMDGIETLAKIRETMPDLPVYALTANATAGGEEFYKSKGFNGYLAKPIDTALLEQAIMKHLPEEIVKKADDADLYEEDEKLSEDISWLNDVEGISVDDGIKNSGGIEAYISSLHMFLDTLEDNAKVIGNAYTEGDIKLYTVKVHALKSSARIIGALEMSAFCQKLEDAGNAKNMEFIDANTGRLIADYRALGEKLRRLGGPDDTGEDDTGKPEISPEELKEAYEALKEFIPQMDYDAVEMTLEQLKEYRLPAEDKERLAKIGKLLKTFSWDEMEKNLGE